MRGEAVNYRIAILGAALFLTYLTHTLLADPYHHEPQTKPPRGLTTEGRVVEVYDGDTVVVEVCYLVRVRLLDCWAPEIRTKDEREKAAGYASRDALADYLGPEAKVTLFVPSADAKTAGDVTSMGRVLGSIWVDDAKHSASAWQVANKHAWPTKEGLKEALKQ